MSARVASNRNFGIDLLRILSMYMVVILHVLGHGGILEAATPGSTGYWLAWGLEIAAYCAVNCFALISGFVMWRSAAKPSKLLNLWLRVFFWTLCITAVFMIFRPGTVGLRQVASALLPVASGQYWYITAYFCMYLFVPFLNAGIEKLPRKTFRNILIGILIIVNISRLFKVDAFEAQGGYSAIWLMILYLIGAYFAKFEIFKKLSCVKSAILFAGAVLVTWASKFVLMRLTNGGYSGDFLISYLSPTILLTAIALLCFGANLRIGARAQKVIRLLAPAALGVYIIHDNPLVRENLMNGKFSFLAGWQPVVMVLSVIGIAAGIYLACTVLELGRIFIFNKVQLAIEARRSLDDGTRGERSNSR